MSKKLLLAVPLLIAAILGYLGYEPIIYKFDRYCWRDRPFNRAMKQCEKKILPALKQGKFRVDAKNSRLIVGVKDVPQSSEELLAKK